MTQRNPPAMHHQRDASRKRRSPIVRDVRRRGVIIIIALFGVLLVAGVFAFTLNTARQIERRIVVQHAADSAARSAAGFTARQFNVISMNNVAMTRILAVVPHLDAQPLAVSMTLKDQTAFRDAIVGHLGAIPPSERWLPDRLRALETQLTEEIEILAPMDEYFSSNDLTRYTHYRGGSGRFWQALEALDQHNQIIMADLGILAQNHSIEAGNFNLRREEMAYAFTLPVVADPPLRRGVFDDFERPVRFGLLPGADNRLSPGNRPNPNGLGQVDHAEFNRGPWDVLFGWRHRIRGAREGYWVGGGGGSNQVVSGNRGGVPFSRAPRAARGSRGTFVTTSQEPDRYGLYSEYQRLSQRTSRFANEHLRQSQFGRYANQIANLKLQYVWPGRRGANRIHDPQWVINIHEAFEIADDPQMRERIRETVYIGSEIKSRYPYGHPQFLSPGSWTWTTRGGRDNPFITPRNRNGWIDPRTWEQSPNVTRLTDSIWRDEFEYQVNFDNEIGLSRRADGQMQTVYRIDHFLFLGIDIGEPIDVSNPYDGLNKTSATAPSPVDFDHSLMLRDENSRFRYLTFMGIARASDEPVLVASRFTGEKADSRGDGTDGGVVGIAQAHVFNNHSWDLWTQMWSAQLQRFREQDFNDWVVRMNYDSGLLHEVPRLDSVYYDLMYDYLLRAAPMADMMLRH
ncbi:MAG: hypothetical protein JJU36_13155 [Phycisphaeraceae bacterium]|nr:hypothetical protein [Phycisphaeraceae bacterium]